MPLSSRLTGISLFRWIWLAYWRAALIPLIVVELALLTAYMLSHNFSKQENIATVEALAQTELQRLTANYADSISEQLTAIAQLTTLLESETTRALSLQPDPQLENPERYIQNAPGQLYSNADDGGAAAYFTGYETLTEALNYKLAQTARIDSLMHTLVDINPLIAQAYFNTWDSLTRIWPSFDVLAQLAPKMNIPAYNFYFAADQTHNPQRASVWIDPYLDPAGQGWMVSSIAPVYTGDFLEGVVGLDITLDLIIQQILSFPVPWQGFAILSSQDGMLLAVPNQASSLLKLPELEQLSYQQLVLSKQFSAAQFDVDTRLELRPLGEVIRQSQDTTATYTADQDYLLATKTLPATGWKLSLFAPQAEIFAPANTLAQRLTGLGWYLLIGLVLFYIAFFAYLSTRAKALSQAIAVPLLGINDMVSQIGKGRLYPDPPLTGVSEFRDTIGHIRLMATQIFESKESLIRARNEADRANHAKSAFLANMSHEIRTPLSAIIGLSDLARDTNSIAQLRLYLDHIHGASSSLLTILNDVLDFSRIEAGKIVLEDEPFNPETLVAEVVSLFAPSMSAKALVFSVNIATNVPRQVRGDAQRLRQILINLIGNAQKFTDSGMVTVKLATRELSSAGACLEFSISDTGSGISEELLDSLFDAFTQADSSITRRFGGSGLGLAICRQLAELMDGNITVSSTPDVGSTFKLELTLAVVQGPHPAAEFTGNERAALFCSDYNLINQLQPHLQQAGLGLMVVNSADSLASLSRNPDNQGIIWIIDYDFLAEHKLTLTDMLGFPAPQPALVLVLSDLNEQFPDTAMGRPYHRYSKPVTPAALILKICHLLQTDLPGTIRHHSDEQPIPQFPDKHFLLVEDVTINQQIGSALLAKTGAKITTASDGKEALALASTTVFDCVLMDVHMPVMDGNEATRQLRKLPGYAHTPIVAMSAGVFTSEQEACLKAGMNDFLAKPLQARALYATLSRWLTLRDISSPEPITKQP